MYMYKAALVFK